MQRRGENDVVTDDRGYAGPSDGLVEHGLPGRCGGRGIAGGVRRDRLEFVFHLRGAGLQAEAAVEAHGAEEGAAVAGQPGAVELAVDPGDGTAGRVDLGVLVLPDPDEVRR